MSATVSVRSRVSGRLFLGLALFAASASALADVITIRADEWLPYNGPTSRKPTTEVSYHNAWDSPVPWSE